MWNPFKKSLAEEESLKLNQIQAQLEEAKKELDRVEHQRVSKQTQAAHDRSEDKDKLVEELVAG